MNERYEENKRNAVMRFLGDIVASKWIHRMRVEGIIQATEENVKLDAQDEKFLDIEKLDN